MLTLRQRGYVYAHAVKRVHSLLQERNVVAHNRHMKLQTEFELAVVSVAINIELLDGVRTLAISVAMK